MLGIKEGLLNEFDGAIRRKESAGISMINKI